MGRILSTFVRLPTEGHQTATPEMELYQNETTDTGITRNIFDCADASRTQHANSEGRRSRRQLSCTDTMDQSISTCLSGRRIVGSILFRLIPFPSEKTQGGKSDGCPTNDQSHLKGAGDIRMDVTNLLHDDFRDVACVLSL